VPANKLSSPIAVAPQRSRSGDYRRNLKEKLQEFRSYRIKIGILIFRNAVFSEKVAERLGCAHRRS
jgi:hypothetical protein